MSLEKIKERIKMIESNNFNITESYINLKQSDYDRIVSDRGAMKSMSDLATGLSNASDANQVAKSALNVQTRVSIGDVIELPSKFREILFKIYREMLNHKILTHEINKSDFSAKIGYKVSDYSGDSERNQLSTERNSDIVIRFDGDVNKDETKLYSIKVRNVRQFGSVDGDPNKPKYVKFIEDIDVDKDEFSIKSILKGDNAQYPSIIIRFTDN